MTSLLPELKFLRPYLYGGIPKGRTSVYRSFSATARYSHEAEIPSAEGGKAEEKPSSEGDRYHVNTRTKALRAAGALEWPRITKGTGADSRIKKVSKFLNGLKLESGETDTQRIRVQGKVASVRTFGTKLVFLTLMDGNNNSVEVMVDGAHTLLAAQTDPAQLPQYIIDLAHNVDRGDYLSACGVPYRNKQGRIILRCLYVPKIIAPALAPLPTKLTDPLVRAKNRHVDMLVNPEINTAWRTRSSILKTLRNYLFRLEFTEVSTPILVERANGAVARPFLTNATEFPEKTLALRVAPEIWLKRLMIGGMERVFEIGPAFRNEGLDGTHNPEFTTCEFYVAYFNLGMLMKHTEGLFTSITTNLFHELPAPSEDSNRQAELAALIAKPFKRIEFIPAIEEAIGEKLPDLESPDAETKLIEIFKSKSLPLPSTPNLPRLLDKLATIYIEPQCESATYIIHHPACMSPLAKSFRCFKTKQMISARAELFIQQREIANMYEEENSPIAQREKFVQQQKWRDDENDGMIDESYIEALEYGLPPTGGWGCGIDRIVMLYTGAKRIGDVLPFGSLRNVVSIGSGSSKKSTEKDEGIKEEETSPERDDV